MGDLIPLSFFSAQCLNIKDPNNIKLKRTLRHLATESLLVHGLIFVQLKNLRTQIQQHGMVGNCRAAALINYFQYRTNISYTVDSRYLEVEGTL